MAEVSTLPWVEKYRPATLQDVAAHTDIVETSASPGPPAPAPGPPRVRGGTNPRPRPVLPRGGAGVGRLLAIVQGRTVP